MFSDWADPRGNAIRGRPVDWVEQAHSTGPDEKNTGNFIGPSSRTVAEITLQRTDTTHDLSSESREAITTATHPKPHLANSHTPNNHMHLHRNTPGLHSQPATANQPHANHTRPSATVLPPCSPIITISFRMQRAQRTIESKNAASQPPNSSTYYSQRAQSTPPQITQHASQIGPASHTGPDSSTHERPCVTAPARAPIHRRQPTNTPQSTELSAILGRQPIN